MYSVNASGGAVKQVSDRHSGPEGSRRGVVDCGAGDRAFTRRRTAGPRAGSGRYVEDQWRLYPAEHGSAGGPHPRRVIPERAAGLPIIPETPLPRPFKGKHSRTLRPGRFKNCRGLKNLLAFPAPARL